MLKYVCKLYFYDKHINYLIPQFYYFHLSFQTWFSASDLGWIVGHSYTVYAPLLHGNTTVLFEVQCSLYFKTTHHAPVVLYDK